MTDTLAETNEIMQQLEEVSKRTVSPIESNANAFARFQFILRGTGTSLQDTLDIVETLQNTFRLSGATTQEAAAATLQLSQAMGAGRLQGDEFRSVMENNVAFAKLLADTLNVTTGELKRMSREGKITTEVMKEAAIGNKEMVDSMVAGLEITVAQAFTNLATEAKTTSNELDDLLGITDLIVIAFERMTESLDNFLLTEEDAAAFRKQIGDVIIGTGRAADFVMNSPVVKAGGILGLLIWGLKGGAIKKLIAGGGIAAILGATDFKSMFDALGQAADNAFAKIAVVDVNKRIKDTEQDIEDLYEAVREGEAPRDAAILMQDLRDRLASYKEDLKHYTEILQDNSKALEENNSKYEDAAKSIIEQWDNLQDRKRDIRDLTNDINLGLSLSFYSLGDQLTEMFNIQDKEIKKWKKDTTQAFLDVATVGSSAIEGLVNSILEDLARLAIQKQIVDPLFGAIEGILSGMNPFGGGESPIGDTQIDFGAGAPVAVAAKGKAFNRGKVLPFARGGVVSGPTIFPMAQGAGLMGEAGPEAVMPLKRTSGGELGVKADGMGTTVIINNNTNQQAQVSETNTPNGKVVEVMIGETVKGMFGSGALDRTMRTNYGLVRQGR
jgi:lambda family phage tail tape measure protein